MSNLGRGKLRELLEQLIKDDDPVGVKFLLRGESDRRRFLYEKNSEGLLPVHQACLTGNTKVVHALLDSGADIEARSSLGWTGLHTAILSGSSHLVEYLLYTCAANVFAKDDMGCLPADLTLDATITKILKTRTEQVRNKSRADSLAYMLPTSNIYRRHSFNVPMKRRPVKILPRALSAQDVRPSENTLSETESEPRLPRRAATVSHTIKYVREESNRDSGIFDDIEEYTGDALRTTSSSSSGIPQDTSVSVST